MIERDLVPFHAAMPGGSELASVEGRFWNFVAPMMDDRGCWEWAGSTKTGYGQLSAQIGKRARRWTAHRFAYQLLVGPIPDGLIVHHRCSNSTCVNPHHLDVVTIDESIRRSEARARRRPAIDRFFSKVDKTETCWLWTGAKDAPGYGVFFDDEPKMVRASRFSYEHHIGPIAHGLLVCHKCDVRACVRPDHLFLGTHSANMYDMYAKNRRAVNLSVEAVAEVRVLLKTMTQRAIARRFNVSSQAIWAIAHPERRRRRNPA